MDSLTIGYALAVAAGGVAGYVKAGSTESLTAGLAFGGLVMLGAYLAANGQPLGEWIVAGTSATLTAVMGRRFANSGKVFPAGVVTLMSVAVLGRFIYYKFLR